MIDDEAQESLSQGGENVQVLVRMRPMNQKERKRREMRTLSIFSVDREQTNQVLRLHTPLVGLSLSMMVWTGHTILPCTRRRD